MGGWRALLSCGLTAPGSRKPVHHAEFKEYRDMEGHAYIGMKRDTQHVMYEGYLKIGV